MKPQHRSVSVDLGARPYQILVGHSLLDQPATWDSAGRGDLAVIVTNTVVGPLYAARLAGALSERFRRVVRLQLEDGEQQKTLETAKLLYDAFLAEGVDRSSVVFALGGGVVGDIAGFVASTYMRGLPLVHVPTTLLAQVDSSVGGKTAVNHRLGKNMLGTFYQPRLVVAALETLKTLPPREYSAGLAEVIKYGPILDAAFLDWTEAHIQELMDRDEESIARAVLRCCELKAAVVAKDERDAGARAVLNFGHTFGHAIEAGLGYGQWLHGEAVGCGMVMALDLSARLGLITRGYAARVTRLIERAGLPTRGPNLSSAQYLELMRHDKKTTKGELLFVVVDGGGVATVRQVDADLVRTVIDACS